MTGESVMVLFFKPAGGICHLPVCRLARYFGSCGCVSPLQSGSAVAPAGTADTCPVREQRMPKNLGVAIKSYKQGRQFFLPGMAGTAV